MKCRLAPFTKIYRSGSLGHDDHKVKIYLTSNSGFLGLILPINDNFTILEKNLVPIQNKNKLDTVFVTHTKCFL